MYISDSVKEVEHDGVFYGLPLEYTNWALYINTRMLNASFPETLEELYQLCSESVVHDNDVITSRLFDFRYPYYLTFLVPLVNQLGGGISNDGGRVTLYNDEAWLKVFNFFASWGSKGDNLGSPTYKNARSMFNKEEIAMCMSGLYQIVRLKEENPTFYNSGDWCVIPFPRFKEAVKDDALGSYLHYFVVNSEQSKEKMDACWALIDFFTNHDKEYLEEAGLLMPKKEMLISSQLKAFPYYDVFIAELEKANLIEHGLYANKIASLLSKAVNELMIEGKSSEKVFESFKTSVESLH